MTKKKKIILGTILALVLVAGGVAIYTTASVPEDKQLAANPFNQDPHSSTGFGTDSARVDSQITLKIPEGQAQAVYDYLRKTYVESNDLLNKNFPKLHLSGEQRTDISNFTDDYFDTSNLNLYANNNSARHRIRINTTDPTDPKSGRELVQIKVTPPGDFTTRTEIKFDTQAPKKSASPANRYYSLVSFVADKQKNDFETAFSDIGLNSNKLRYILTNEQQRSRVYLDWDGENFLSFSVDDGRSHILWAKARITSVDLGLVENVYTAADESKRKTLGEIRNLVLQDLQNHFPELTQTTQEKYGILLDQLTAKIRWIKWLVKWKII